MALIRPPKKDSDFQASYWRITHAELCYPENSEKAFGIVKLAGFESAEARAAGKHLTCIYPPILLGAKHFPHDGQRVDFYAAVKLACPYFADAEDDNAPPVVTEEATVVAAQAIEPPADEVEPSDLLEDERNAHPELFSNTDPDPMGEALERQREANAKLVNGDHDLPTGSQISDWEGVEGVPSAVPAEIAALLDEGETLTKDVRRKLTERLNVELAELKNLRGLAGEDLKREAEIEKLLGLFARLGEI